MLRRAAVIRYGGVTGYGGGQVVPVGVVDRASANDPAWHPRYHIWWSERSIPSLPDGLPKWCVGARCREITLHHAVGSINSNLTPKPWSKLLNYFACHSGWSAMWLLHAVGRHCAGSLPCCHRMIDVGGLSCNGPLNLYHALTARLLGVSSQGLKQQGDAAGLPMSTDHAILHACFMCRSRSRDTSELCKEAA